MTRLDLKPLTHGARQSLHSVSFTKLGFGVAQIAAIRVQDIARGKWYNWDNGSWDSSGEPVITPGSSNLYVAFAAFNPFSGTFATTLTIQDASGNIKNQVVVNIPARSYGGIEWTGRMPSSPYGLTLIALP